MLKEQYQKDLIHLLASLCVAIILFIILFSNEGAASIIKIVLGTYLVFIIPGMIVTYLFWENIAFLNRFVIGFALGSAIIGILSYYLAFAGLHVKYHHIILPILIIVVSLLVAKQKKLFLFKN